MGVPVKNGYDEQHQFNLRAIYALAKSADVGVFASIRVAEGNKCGELMIVGLTTRFSAHTKKLVLGFHALFTILLLCP